MSLSEILFGLNAHYRHLLQIQIRMITDRFLTHYCLNCALEFQLLGLRYAGRHFHKSVDGIPGS